MYSRLIIVVSLLFLLVAAPVTVFAQSPVVINEVLVHPSAGGKEWVEFYVTDGAAVQTYWIDDDSEFTNETGSAKKSLETVLQGNDSQHFFIELNGAMFNNTEDMVVLFNAQGEVVDQLKYTEGPGYDVTFGRTPDGTGGFSMLNNMTRGSTNSGPKPTMTPTPMPTDKPTKAATNDATETPSSSKSTSTPTVRATATPFPTRKVSVAPKVSTTSAKRSSQSAYPTAILGASTKVSPTRYPLPSIPVKVQGASNTPALFTILGGGGIIACAVVVFLKKLRQHG